MVKKNLVTAVLLKRGRTAFLYGSAFHWVLDPVSESDTDKIKGLVFRHPGDKYKWWHKVTDRVLGVELMVSFPALTCWSQRQIPRLTFVPSPLRAAASMKLTPAMKTLLADPAITFVSTGGVREEWLCVQEECGKTHGTSFEKAVEHVQSVRHGTGLLKAGAATRLSMGKPALGQEYTFRVRATGSTSRIDRALVLVSLLGNLEGARHVEVPRKLSGHSFAIKIRLKFVSEHASGPRLWRFNATRKKKEGVRKIVKAVAEALNRSSQGSLERVISRLSTGLRMHEKEERKRVAATQLHLTEEVERMRHLVMGGPSGDTTKALLLTREEQLEAYRENERERLEVFEGLTEELQGEIPSPFLSAKVKMRNAR
ncbi:unnamed protein product [Closterium sp. NIES-64]|nr:unnamed protein product [Closterium sp. NIES-64]